MGTEAGSGEEGGLSHQQELRHFEPPLQAAAHSVSLTPPPPTLFLYGVFSLPSPRPSPILRTLASQALLAMGLA